MRALYLLPWAALLGCGSTTLICGPGTTAKNGACVLSGDGCGANTKNAMGTCQASGPALQCGASTHEGSGVCVPNPPGDPMLAVTPWSANVRVGSPDRVGSSPSIAVDSRGRIFVALQIGNFFGGSIEVWESDDGMGFNRVFVAPPATIAGPSPLSALSPSIAIDATDRVAVVYAEINLMTGANAVFGAISVDGAHYATHEIGPVSSFSSAVPAVGRAADGNFVATWADDFGISTSISSTISESFGAPSVVQTFPRGQAAGGPSQVEAPLAFDSNHRGLLIADVPTGAPDAGASEFDLVAYLLSPSATEVLSVPLGITRHFGFQTAASLASDPSGRFRILVSNSISRRVGIFELRSDDGRMWGDPVRVFDDPSEPTANAPSIAADENGGLHALFCDTRTGGWLTYAAHAPPGGDFGTPVRVSEVEAIEGLSGPVSALATALAVRSGHRYAAWADLARGGIFFSTAPTP
jgi:hypothetical protein